MSTELVVVHVASTLVQAMETHRTNWHTSADLLKALFKLQPKALLDALAAVQVEPGVTMASIGWSYNHRGNPADAIPEAELVAWCNEDAASRYRFAASIITFAHRPDKSGPLVWSEQAKALLKQAPDPSSVLKAIVARFRPRSWKGSRASIIEANTQLLDDVGSHIPAELRPFVDEAKAQLAQEIAREREWETRHDQVRDERFE